MLNETSYFGKGAREELAGEINKRGFKKVFLVSDKSLVDAGVTAKIETVLKNANIKYDLYDEIKPNPTIKNVTDGVEACKKSKADVIICLHPMMTMQQDVMERTLMPMCLYIMNVY